MQKYNVDLAGMTPRDRALIAHWRDGLEYAFWIALAATLLARWLRTRIGATYRVRHASGRVITAPVGRSILEAIRDEGLPHASVCGGRARCTTCRVRVSDGLAHLPPPGRMEAQALGRIEAPPNVRLACQCRPTRDVAVTPLLPPNAGPSSALQPRSGAQGRERRIVAMFVDLRDSTRLAEGRLPYDVVFIMNQFFAEMHAALRATGGYYAQFRGDGLLALYGLESSLATACRAALEGAAEMQTRIEQLNQQPRRRAEGAAAHRHRHPRRRRHRRHHGTAGRADLFGDRRHGQHRRAPRRHDQGRSAAPWWSRPRRCARPASSPAMRPSTRCACAARPSA